MRDDVLARLLALKVERDAEVVAQGLQSKSGNRRGRPAKTIQGVETVGQQVEQIELGL